jgi:cytochrome b561
VLDTLNARRVMPGVMRSLFLDWLFIRTLFMQKDKFKRAVIASIPLILVTLLVIAYGTSIETYIRCEGSNNCLSIPGNLGKFLVLDSPKVPEPIPDDADDVIRKKEIKKYEPYAARYGGRITWIFFRLAYIISCLAAFAIACYVIYQSFANKGDEKSKLDKGAVFLALGVALSSAFGILLYNHREQYMSVIIPIFEKTIEYDLKNIADVMTQVNSFGFAVCLFVVLATCSILYSANDEASRTGLKQLSTKMKYLQLILYVGTIMLVVGILLIRSMYQWSLAFILRDEQAVKVAESFYSSLLAAEGGFFTLILAAVYLPAALILRSRADSLEGLPKENADKEKLLKDYNLTFSFAESLPRILAILGPLLAGPIGELFSRLSQ